MHDIFPILLTQKEITYLDDLYLFTLTKALA